MELDAMILSFFEWWVSSQLFHSCLSPSLGVSSSSMISVIREVLSAYLGLLTFLPAILIPAYASSSPAFHMMYSAYKLNRHGDNIQPWCTPFAIWNQSIVPCPFLLLLDLHTVFSEGRLRWSGIPISFNNFSVCCDLHSKALFSIVNEAKVDVFLKFPCYFYDPRAVSNLISGSSAFSKSSLDIWEFSIHLLLLKPSLENSEYNFASMWNECTYEMVWTFFGIRMKTDLFQFCGLLPKQVCVPMGSPPKNISPAKANCI